MSTAIPFDSTTEPISKKKQQPVVRPPDMGLERQAGAASERRTVAATSPAAATASRSTSRSPKATTNRQPSAGAAPVEPEQHVDGDAVESIIRKLKGTRPDLLRTTTYYGVAKNVYITLAGLPVLSSIAPILESATESIINMTPLKPSPEEAEQKSVAVLDKRICNALSYADEVVDAKKDDTIEGIVSIKKNINSLGPVKNAVGMVCDVGDGVGKVCNSANDTASNVWHQVFDTVSNTYKGATSMAGDAVNCVTNTAGGAYNNVTTTTCNVVGSAKCTASNTVNGVKSIVGNTTDAIGSNVQWVASTTTSIASSIISYPGHLFQSIMGTAEPASGD